MYAINQSIPKNCSACWACQGEYGPGNEKSFCALQGDGSEYIKLKYKGGRPKNCPLIELPESSI